MRGCNRAELHREQCDQQWNVILPHVCSTSPPWWKRKALICSVEEPSWGPERMVMSGSKNKKQGSTTRTRIWLKICLFQPFPSCFVQMIRIKLLLYPLITTTPLQILLINTWAMFCHISLPQLCREKMPSMQTSCCPLPPTKRYSAAPLCYKWRGSETYVFNHSSEILFQWISV